MKNTAPKNNGNNKIRPNKENRISNKRFNIYLIFLCISNVNIQDNILKKGNFRIRLSIKLRNGKDGKREIVFTEASEIPRPSDILKMQAKEDFMVNYTFVPKDIVNDYRYHISVAPSPKPRRTSSQKILRTLQKYRMYAVAPTIDPRQNDKKLIEAFGDDPEEMQVPEPQAPPTMGMGNNVIPNNSSQRMPQSVSRRPQTQPNQPLAPVSGAMDKGLSQEEQMI
jgi:hypothetical protein